MQLNINKSETSPCPEKCMTIGSDGFPSGLARFVWMI